MTTIKNIEHVGKCLSCGAVTVTFTDKNNPSMPAKTFEEKFGKISRNKDKRGNVVFTWNRKSISTWGNCNYCVNHWGIDLCDCGSEKEYEKCCGTPAQSLTENIKQLHSLMLKVKF